MIEVLDPGPLSTVQDLGRSGHAALGVPASGAFDRAALRLANRLVGNPEDSAGIEITLGGLRITTDRAVSIALTGAVCTGAAFGEVTTLAAGAHLRLGRPAVGLRSYLAVRGGLDVPTVFGSRSTDTLSGLGPDLLVRGARLAVGAPTGTVSGALAVPRPVAVPIPIVLGPRDDWFTAAALDILVRTSWRVRAQSDRVGVRLDGPALSRARTGELPSEAVRRGAIQVPGDGRPIVFGPDAPVTGGYPVIAVVPDPDALAQRRPGDEVCFRVVD